MPAAEPVSGTIPLSLRAFLTEIIDYAGLFPPARLELETALANYARYRTSGDAWMLGRFIIPVDRLEDLDAFADLFSTAPPFRFSVLGRSSTSVASFPVNFADDLATMGRFERRHEGRVACDAMEVRMPSAGGERRAARQMVDAMAAALINHERRSIPVYVEVPWNEDEALEAAADAVAAVRKESDLDFSLKLRSGGIEPTLFPPPERVAHFLVRCRDAGVPFKTTAGLHHPIRRYHGSVDTHMHGFINVFGGAALLHAGEVTEIELIDLLLDENPSSFAFVADGFRWRDRSISSRKLEDARRFARSFGSCSFDEPREDLRSLQLL